MEEKMNLKKYKSIEMKYLLLFYLILTITACNKKNYVTVPQRFDIIPGFYSKSDILNSLEQNWIGYSDTLTFKVENDNLFFISAQEGSGEKYFRILIFRENCQEKNRYQLMFNSLKTENELFYEVNNIDSLVIISDKNKEKLISISFKALVLKDDDE
ncbi:MAG TPA: hypothetical protein PKD51_04705 [Saprospiraceae bacterium]|nr:hypothetical protein [Saprospiraceae bacterium]